MTHLLTFLAGLASGLIYANARNPRQSRDFDAKFRELMTAVKK